jgi:hypothetical protein
LVGILHCKDTKSGIKIPGFHQNIKDFQNKKCLLLSKNFLKISLKILLIFRHLFYQSELIFGCIFYKPSIKIPDLRQSVQKYIFLKNVLF